MLEHGVTGAKEVLVMLVENSNLQTKTVVQEYVEHPIFGRVLKSGKIMGWVKDPYDPQFDNIALFNLADHPQYDAKFPDHPLSRVRRKLSHIINTVQFGRDIIDAAEFRNSSL